MIILQGKVPSSATLNQVLCTIEKLEKKYPGISIDVVGDADKKIEYITVFIPVDYEFNLREINTELSSFFVMYED